MSRDYEELYNQEHGRFCEMSGLISALQLVANDLGGMPIEDRELALSRDALCGITAAMARLADMPG